MSGADRNERALQRRLRETRARRVLVSAGLLSVLGGTATIYVANAHPHQPSSLIPAATATSEPVIPTDAAKSASLGNQTAQGQANAASESKTAATQPTSSATMPNVTVPPTPTPIPEETPTSTPTPEIVIAQPASHSRSHSTSG